MPNEQGVVGNSVVFDGVAHPIAFSVEEVERLEPVAPEADKPQPPPESERTPEVAPVAEETPKPETPEAEPKAAEAEPAAPATPAPAAADTPASFDPETYGLSPSEYKRCKSPEDALRLIVVRQSNLQRVLDRQAMELGELRKRPPSTGDTPSSSPAPSAAPTQQQVEAELASWTSEQRVQYQEWSEREPERAMAWLTQQCVGGLLAQRDRAWETRMRGLEEKLAAAQEAPHRDQMNREYAEFRQAHAKDYADAESRVLLAAEALGTDPRKEDTFPLEDLCALGAIAEADPAAFAFVSNRMLEGWKFAEVKEYHDLRGKEVQRHKEEAERERAEAERKKTETKAKAAADVEKARQASLTGTGRGGAPAADTEVHFGVSDVMP